MSRNGDLETSATSREGMKGERGGSAVRLPVGFTRQHRPHVEVGERVVCGHGRGAVSGSGFERKGEKNRLCGAIRVPVCDDGNYYNKTTLMYLIFFARKSSQKYIRGTFVL